MQSLETRVQFTFFCFCIIIVYMFWFKCGLSVSLRSVTIFDQTFCRPAIVCVVEDLSGNVVQVLPSASNADAVANETLLGLDCWLGFC